MASRTYGTRQLSQKRAAAALTQLLYGCAPERLAGFTAQGLAGSYNVTLATAETMLAAARRERVG